MMSDIALFSTTLNSGETVALETSSLPSGTLGLKARAVPVLHLALTDAKSDAGVALTATATGGAMGVARTAGTSLALVGEATSSNAKTDKAMWEFNIPTSYNDGAVLPVTVNASVAGTGTLTAVSTTLALAAYSEIDGVEAALSTSGGTQQMVAAGSNLSWNIAASNSLVAGQRLALELTMLVTTSTGANTGHINKVAVG